MAIRIRKHLRNIFWGTYEDVMNPLLKREKNKWVCSERIFENAYTIGTIAKLHPQNILDVGCARSTMPIELATLGFNVTGIDLRSYPLKHPNFQFINGEFLDLKFNLKFMCVTCISVFEHVGLGAYNEPPDKQKISEFAEKIADVLDRGGHLILTLPLHTHRPGFIQFLSLEDIMKYFGRLQLAEKRFFQKSNDIYVETEHNGSQEMIACFLFKKL